MNEGLSLLGSLHGRFLNCDTKTPVPPLTTFQHPNMSISLQHQLPPHPSHNPLRLLLTFNLQSPTSMKTLRVLRLFHFLNCSPYRRMGGLEFPVHPLLDC